MLAEASARKVNAMVVRLLHVVAVLALVCSGVSSATAAHSFFPADSPFGVVPDWPLTMGAASVQARPQVPPGATAPQAPAQGRPGAPARDAAPPSATGTAAITGQVATADGRPVRKAAVRASSPQLREGRSAVTDANGRYELTNLPAGRYTLFASKGGYQAVSFGATAEGLPGKPVDVEDKARVDGIDFILPRGCVITGRVYDEFGEPASEVNMVAALERSVGGRRRLMQTGSGRSTDDRGEFRLFNLRPGDYVVSGTARQLGAVTSRTEADREGYAATYYPGTPSPAEARRVPCVAGQETTGIDFTLATVRTVQVSGRVLDVQGRPASGFVSLRPARSELWGGMTGGGQIRPDGTFNLFNVVPGEYYLQAMSTSTGPTGPRQFAHQPVSVTDTDITGLVLQLGPGARLSGRVLMDGQESFDFQRSNVRIGLQPLEPDSPGPMVGNTSGVAQPDGSFDLAGLFGQFLVRAYGPSGAWRLKTVRVDGRDVTDVPLDLRGNVEVKDVELVLTNRLSTLTVTVQDERGAPVSDAMVIVFADDAERWRYPSRFVAVARPTGSTDPSKITTLPPGRYLAAAIAFDPQGDSMDPALLERLRPDAEPVTLTDGETVTLTLKKKSLQ
jgi:protocatechuate 3,4-dioxygenase beta subunit